MLSNKQQYLFLSLSPCRATCTAYHRVVKEAAINI